MVSNLFTFLRNKGFTWSLALCILTLPFQLKILAFETEWGKGFTNPYTSIYFSLFDCALLLSAFFFLIYERKKAAASASSPLLLLFAVLAIFSFFFTPYDDSLFHLLLVVKLLELILFYHLLTKVQDKEFLSRIFIYIVSVEGIWAFLQVLFQRDFGLQILGEPNLAAAAPNLARFTWGSWEFIRGYGTFPHPNILGGFLALGILLTFLNKNISGRQKIVLLILQFLGLLSSFSRSALLALLLVILVTGFEKKFFQKQKTLILFGLGAGLLLTLFFVMRGSTLLEDPAFLERLNGYSYAWSLIQAHPWGVGFSHFTLFLDSVSSLPLMPWEYQPVHNVFLLLLSELGWLSFALLLGAALAQLYQKIKTRTLLWGAALLLLIIGFFDHYLLTLDQGRFLAIFVLAILSFKREGNSDKNPADPQ